MGKRLPHGLYLSPALPASTKPVTEMNRCVMTQGEGSSGGRASSVRLRPTSKNLPSLEKVG